jgi:hypothetical protein
MHLAIDGGGTELAECVHATHQTSTERGFAGVLAGAGIVIVPSGHRDFTVQ